MNSEEEGGVPRSTWGPALWTSLHAIAYGFPVDPTPADVQAARQFVESLRWLIPCKECRQHYGENIRKLPPTLSSREAFVSWTVNLHNLVSSQLGKKEWSEKQAVDYWTGGKGGGCGCAARAIKKRTVSAGFLGLLVGVVAVVIILLIISACRKCTP